MKTETIDFTPSWSEILPAMLAVSANNPSNPHIMEEFRKMAKLADLYVKNQKEQKK